jgi:hypothetical protein
MTGGVLVLGVFAVLWASAAVLGAGSPAWMIVFPVLVSAGLYLWASRSSAPPRLPEEVWRIRRAVGIWSAVEGVAILIAVNVLRNVGAPDAVGSAIAIVVGLHFLALARAFPQPLYYWTGAGLIIVGGAALLLPMGPRLPVIGCLAALDLWISAGLIIFQGRRAAH